MNNFNRNNRSREKRRDFDKRERPQMHEAVCSDCGRKCEVPFRPTGEKPVYCNDCFQDHRSSRGPERPSPYRDRFPSKSADMPKASNQYKEGFDRIAAKLDTIINILTAKKETKEILSAPKKPKKEAVKKKPASKKKK